MTHFHSDDVLKSEISYFQIFIFIDFQALATKFGLALEPTVLRLEGNYFIRLLSGCVVERLEKTGLRLTQPRLSSDGPPKSEVSHFQKCLGPYHRLNCSQTDFITDLPMV